MKKDLTARSYLALALLSWFFFLALAADAQIQNIKFNHLTDANGLSQNHAMCTYQDSRGFMWFGTYAGLNRYDGKNFLIYKNNSADHNSPKTDVVFFVSLTTFTFGGVDTLSLTTAAPPGLVVVGVAASSLFNTK